VLRQPRLSPADALARTNAVSFGSASAAFQLSRAGDCGEIGRDGIVASHRLGRGSLVVERIDPRYLRQAIPVLLIAIAIYLTLSAAARRGEEARQRMAVLPFNIGLGVAAWVLRRPVSALARAIWAIDWRYVFCLVRACEGDGAH